jgi:hypothetical protein
MNLEISIMKEQKSAKEIARELEVNFDENEVFVAPSIRRMQKRNK